MSTITITVTGVEHNIKWGGDDGLHEKITNILTTDNGAYKIGSGDNELTQEEVAKLKADITPAAAAYKDATKKTQAFDEAVIAAEDVNNNDNDGAKLATLIAAIKTFKENTAAPAAAPVAESNGGRSKRGGSKKRRGKSKRGGSKRRGSKRRKY